MKRQTFEEIRKEIKSYVNNGEALKAFSIFDYYNDYSRESFTFKQYYELADIIYKAIEKK